VLREVEAGADLLGFEGDGEVLGGDGLLGEFGEEGRDGLVGDLVEDGDGLEVGAGEGPRGDAEDEGGGEGEFDAALWLGLREGRHRWVEDSKRAAIQTAGSFGRLRTGSSTPLRFAQDDNF
jgi:hypothetical protein